MKSGQEAASLAQKVKYLFQQATLRIPPLPRLEVMTKQEFNSVLQIQDGQLRKIITISVISLSMVCLVCQSLIEFDPATLTQELTLWTPLTCHLASTSVFELVVFLLMTNYLIDQVQQTWTLKRFSLMFMTSCLLQSISYWCFWLVSNLVVPRRWILGEKAVLCGLSSLMIFILMIIRMEQPQR